MELDKLYNSDCIKGMNQIEPGSIDLAFADPPFNIGYDYDVYEDQAHGDQTDDTAAEQEKVRVRSSGALLSRMTRGLRGPQRPEQPPSPCQ